MTCFYNIIPKFCPVVKPFLKLIHIARAFVLQKLRDELINLKKISMQFQKKCNQYTSLCSWHNICVRLGEVKLGLFCRFSNFFFLVLKPCHIV